jgi:hypothetical protein
VTALDGAPTGPLCPQCHGPATDTIPPPKHNPAEVNYCQPCNRLFSGSASEAQEYAARQIARRAEMDSAELAHTRFVDGGS